MVVVTIVMIRRIMIMLDLIMLLEKLMYAQQSHSHHIGETSSANTNERCRGSAETESMQYICTREYMIVRQLSASNCVT